MNEQSFMKSLFHGVIAENMVFPYPSLGAAEADHVTSMLESVRRFCAENVDGAQIDREGAISPAVLAGLKDLGLFGLLIPKEYGGAGLSITAYARVLQEVGGIDLAIAVTMAAHQSIGAMGILLFGTEEQKRRYLPKLATGAWVAAFALSESGAGSDAAAIQTRAERASLRGSENAAACDGGDGGDGGERDGYVLNGSKVWITNGGFADVFTVFARTSPNEFGSKPKITAFIVDRAFGVESGPNEPKLGIRGCSTTSVSFNDIKVPASNVLGDTGRGFRVAMEVLNRGRLGLASSCVGLSKRLIHLAVQRVQERKAFGRPIGEFGLIKDKIAVMMAETFALESMTYLTTGLVDANVGDYSVESAICKVYGSETLWRVANEVSQVAAGAGYMQDFPYERLLRDARVNLVFEGTNEILRCFIALSGLQGPGRAIVEVAKAVREPIKGFGLLSDFAIRKARTALGRERLTRHHPILNREALVFELYTTHLAKGVEKVLRKHGNNIAEMQFTQKRVADIAIDLFAIASVIARTTRAIEKRGEEGARREIDLTSIFVSAAEKRLAESVSGFDKNDDELRKSVATKTYGDRGYPLEIL